MARCMVRVYVVTRMVLFMPVIGLTTSSLDMVIIRRQMVHSLEEILKMVNKSTLKLSKVMMKASLMKILSSSSFKNKIKRRKELNLPSKNRKKYKLRERNLKSLCPRIMIILMRNTNIGKNRNVKLFSGTKKK